MQANRRAAEKDAVELTETPFGGQAEARLYCSGGCFAGGPGGPGTPLLTMDLSDLIILTVDGDQGCRSALLSPSCSALKSSDLVAHPYPAYAGGHPLDGLPNFQGPGSERNLTLNPRRGHPTRFDPAPAAIAPGP